MIDSLQRYRNLVEVNPEKYLDNSGLFEIIESAYIQLCESNPWFNVYTEYSYYNVVKDHQIEISKILDLDGSNKIFTRVLIHKYSGSKHFQIYRVDYKDCGRCYEESVEYDFGAETFKIIYNYLKDWFDENLIHVKNYKLINKDEQQK